MSRLEIIDVVADILFIFFLILNSVYVKALEKELNALKSWIEVFWKIDFGKMSEAVERLKKESQECEGGQTMPWMSCEDCEHCLYKNCSANEYPCILCCRGIEKYDMWKSERRMKGADDE